VSLLQRFERVFSFSFPNEPAQAFPLPPPPLAFRGDFIAPETCWTPFSPSANLSLRITKSLVSLGIPQVVGQKAPTEPGMSPSPKSFPHFALRVCCINLLKRCGPCVIFSQQNKRRCFLKPLFECPSIFLCSFFYVFHPPPNTFFFSRT